jgi:hypothetical protein
MTLADGRDAPGEGPIANMMGTDAHEELYRILLMTADECPLEVIANCMEILAVVMNRRLHDMAEQADLEPGASHCCEHGFFEGECPTCV